MNWIWRKYLLEGVQWEITVYYPYWSSLYSSSCFSLPSSCVLISITIQRSQYYEFGLYAEWVSKFPILASAPNLLAYRTLSAPASWIGSVTQASAGKHNTLLVLEKQKTCLVGQCAWFICNSISFIKFDTVLVQT